MTTAEEHQLEDIRFQLQHGYLMPALAIVEDMLSRGHLHHAPLIPMVRHG
jgi:hypothetical protein